MAVYYFLNMDNMNAHRKKRLEQLLAAPPFNGDRAAFMKKTGISKGRITQLLDPEEVFGEVAARNLAGRLKLNDERWFDKGGMAEPSAWPFTSITPDEFYALSDDVRRAAEAVLLSGLPSGKFRKPPPSADGSEMAA